MWSFKAIEGLFSYLLLSVELNFEILQFACVTDFSTVPVSLPSRCAHEKGFSTFEADLLVLHFCTVEVVDHSGLLTENGCILARN